MKNSDDKASGKKTTRNHVLVSGDLHEQVEREQELGHFGSFSETARRAMVLGLEVLKQRREQVPVGTK